MYLIVKQQTVSFIKTKKTVFMLRNEKKNLSKFKLTHTPNVTINAMKSKESMKKKKMRKKNLPNSTSKITKRKTFLGFFSYLNQIINQI